jgi:hypothetical protein
MHQTSGVKGMHQTRVALKGFIKQEWRYWDASDKSGVKWMHQTEVALLELSNKSYVTGM